jgi:hypothetical protein
MKAHWESVLDGGPFDLLGRDEERGDIKEPATRDEPVFRVDSTIADLASREVAEPTACLPNKRRIHGRPLP